MAADLSNDYMAYNRSPTPDCGLTLRVYSIITSPLAYEARFQAADVYMADINCLAQDSPAQQQQVTEMVLKGIKDVFPSLPADIKNSIILKKAQQGDGDWVVQKEILGWIFKSEAGMFQLPSLRLKELKAFLDISPTQRCIAVPKLRSLIGKLRSMHLAVAGAIGHFFYTQEAMTKAGNGTRAYVSKAFHWEISHWQQLCNDSFAQPRFLTEVVQRLPTALGFCDAPGMGAGGV